MTSALMPVADGVEEMEVVVAVDMLRRAGWRVTMAGLTAGPITASRGVRLIPDTTLDDQVSAKDFDVLLISGGAKGVANLRVDARVIALVRAFAAADKWIGAVCAGPLVLQDAGILKGRHATYHPGVAEELTDPRRIAGPVVVDGHIVTSQGPGTMPAYILTLIRLVSGDAIARDVAKGMVLDPSQTAFKTRSTSHGQ